MWIRTLHYGCKSHKYKRCQVGLVQLGYSADEDTYFLRWASADGVSHTRLGHAAELPSLR